MLGSHRSNNRFTLFDAVAELEHGILELMGTRGFI